jgi:hypothetical protein
MGAPRGFGAGRLYRNLPLVFVAPRAGGGATCQTEGMNEPATDPAASGANPAVTPAVLPAAATVSEPAAAATATVAEPVDSWHVGRLVAAWMFAAAFGIVVTVLVPDSLRFEWLAFAVGASVLCTFALQLGTAQREGFISRTSFSVAGATVIIAAIDVVGLLTR